MRCNNTSRKKKKNLGNWIHFRGDLGVEDNALRVMMEKDYEDVKKEKRC